MAKKYSDKQVEALVNGLLDILTKFVTPEEVVPKVPSYEDTLKAREEAEKKLFEDNSEAADKALKLAAKAEKKRLKKLGIVDFIVGE